MSWIDTIYGINAGLQNQQLVPPTYTSPTAGWYSPDQPVGPTYTDKGNKWASGITGTLAALTSNPVLGAISVIAGLVGSQNEKERMRKAEEKRRALELASWASENYKNAGWGGY